MLLDSRHYGLEAVDEILKCDQPDQSYEKYLLVVLFTTLCKEFLNFGSVDEIVKCDHSNKSY